MIVDYEYMLSHNSLPVQVRGDCICSSFCSAHCLWCRCYWEQL